MNPRSAAVAGVGLLAALTGCGTTVPMTGTVAGQSAPPGLQLDESQGQTGLPAAPGKTSGNQGSAVTPVGQPTRPSSTGSAGVGAVPDTLRSRRGSLLPGVTATTISVGISFLDTAAVNAAIGATGASGSKAGDIRAEHRAVAKWINDHGGVAGRRLRLVEHEVNINDDVSTASQATCQAWTVDDKVAAGLGVTAGAGAGPLVACLAQHHTLAIGTLYDVGARSEFQRYQPYYYAPASLEMVTAGRVYVDGLASQGYFSRGAKVGILVYDAPEFHEAMRDGVLPALRRQGITSPDTVWIKPPSALSDQGSLVAAIQSATLKMAADGVTHMLFLDGNASISYFFMKQAQSQRYTPRYGLSTLSYPSFLQGNFGADQLHGALTVGWMPTEDVDMPHLPRSSARSLCEQIMKAAGLAATAETDLTVQLSICSEFFLLKAGLESATELTAPGAAQGVASLGRTATTAAAGILDGYSSGKPWGAAQYRLGAYGESCSCFTYRGAPRAA